MCSEQLKNNVYDPAYVVFSVAQKAQAAGNSSTGFVLMFPSPSFSSHLLLFLNVAPATKQPPQFPQKKPSHLPPKKFSQSNTFLRLPWLWIANLKLHQGLFHFQLKDVLISTSKWWFGDPQWQSLLSQLLGKGPIDLGKTLFLLFLENFEEEPRKRKNNVSPFFQALLVSRNRRKRKVSRNRRKQKVTRNKRKWSV